MDDNKKLALALDPTKERQRLDWQAPKIVVIETDNINSGSTGVPENSSGVMHS